MLQNGIVVAMALPWSDSEKGRCPQWPKPFDNGAERHLTVGKALDHSHRKRIGAKTYLGKAEEGIAAQDPHAPPADSAFSIEYTAMP